MENELCNVLKYLCFREIKGSDTESYKRYEVESFLENTLYKSNESEIDKEIEISENTSHMLYKYNEYKDIYDKYCIYIYIYLYLYLFITR